ncbi:hypothetical protein MNB_SM-4-297 [hydrothermal vent metagenome]|uniref:Uncharacterized protein n=1 Tax=hydrothermal vent metagenome TaxID=652676 RepID=A0A1W1BV23_9ZZZZ
MSITKRAKTKDIIIIQKNIFLKIEVSLNLLMETLCRIFIIFIL